MTLKFTEEAEKLDVVKREMSSLRAGLSRVTRERDKLIQQLGLIESLEKTKPQRPDWLTPKGPPKEDHHATLSLLITDTHFDEVVDPAEVHGINCYNREIAELRLRRAVEKTIMLARHYLSGVKYDGLVLFLGGDIFSGNIHEELARTNADTLFGSLLHWLGPMGNAIGMLTDEFKKVHIAGAPGNHGRMTRKPIAKHRATDNLDWLFYRLLKRDFARDSRITWEIPPSADAHVKIYSTRYLLTHGDQFRGGSGISGALAPLMLGAHRKTRRQAAAGRPYDYMVMGHWHQHLFLPAKGVLAGPCLKGYDEYAFVCVTPGTRVLSRDLQWHPVEKLVPGDDLWAFTESPVAYRGQPKPFRVWAPSRVLSTTTRSAPTLILRMASGRTLTSTPNHQWLSRTRANKPTCWRRADQLRVGWQLPHYLDPWDRLQTYDAGWLAAIMDGEGSFGWRHGQSNLTITQNEGPTLQQARNRLAAMGYHWGESSAKDHPAKHLVIKGSMREKLALLGAVGADRLISKIKAGNRLQTSESEYDKIILIEPGPVQDVVVLQTSSGTFFADGYGAHNCNFEPEPPQQALWLTTPEHGITFTAPVFVMDRRAEKW